MIQRLKTATLIALVLIASSACTRGISIPGFRRGEKAAAQRVAWQYGANDLRIQATKVNKKLIENWLEGHEGKPLLYIAEVDNRTDWHIDTEMLQDIFTNVAINDGRYDVTMEEPDTGDIPVLRATILLTKKATKLKYFEYEDYIMTITVFDNDNQQKIDSAWDILRKRVEI